MLRWDVLPSSEGQCKREIAYKLRYWEEGNESGTARERDISSKMQHMTMEGLHVGVSYAWAVEGRSEYKARRSEVRVFRVCAPSEPPKPVLPRFAMQERSAVVLRWDGVEFNETCKRANKTGYRVYVAGPGEAVGSARPTYVSVPNVTVRGLSDGVYSVAVAGENSGVAGQQSAPQRVRVCRPVRPERPEPWVPRQNVIQQVRYGVSFEVAPLLSKGSRCKALDAADRKRGEVVSDADVEEIPGRYKLYLISTSSARVVGEYPETNLSVVTSLSKNVYRLAEETGLEYGNNMWVVEYTNGDGLSTNSSVYSFYACDMPLATQNMTPGVEYEGDEDDGYGEGDNNNNNNDNNDNNSSDSSIISSSSSSSSRRKRVNMTVVEGREVTLRWSIGEKDFGEPCTGGDRSRTNMVRVYLEMVDVEGLMAAQGKSDPDEVDYTEVVPMENVANRTVEEALEYRVENVTLGATYAWRTEAFNGYEGTPSGVLLFRVTSLFCSTTDCSGHGTCVEANRTCVCEEGFAGADCDLPAPKAKGGSVLGAALGGSLGGIVLIALIVALVLLIFMRKSGRKRVVLEGPGGDIRFSRVKVPAAAREKPSEETAAIEERVREDCERVKGGAELAEGFVFAQEYREKIKADGIDDTVKAVLYAYYRQGCGRELLKLFISGEVARSQRPETLFRQNSPATVMFKHWSKIVGLDYLFACFSDVLKGLIQHEVDAANDRKSDISLQLFNDTCEVDPTRIQDDEDVDQLLAVNAIQLSLTVQRFATQIYRSVTKIPYEIKDICLHIYTTIEAAYPGCGVRGVSAFLFLRFYSVSISVPEVYGLLKGKTTTTTTTT